MNTTTVSFEAKKCLELFTGLSTTLNSTPLDPAQRLDLDYEITKLAIEDARARFRGWGTNIAAFHNSAVRTSLDSRLKEAPGILGRTLQVLTDLREYLTDINLIISGDKENAVWSLAESSTSSDYSDEVKSDTEEEGEEETTSSLQELLKAIIASVSSLMKLSILIRSSPNRDDYIKAASRYNTWSAYPDIGHVREKYGNARYSEPWLLDRLGKTITRRRQFLKYRVEHHEKMTVEKEVVEKPEGPPMTIVASTKATTFVGQENFASNIPKPISEAGSFGSLTSYDPTVFGIDGAPTLLAVPSPPTYAFPDVEFVYGEPFQCPYCFTEQIVKNKSAWKKHVFRDLKPYVCTFEGCAMLMFKSRKDWFAHEMKIHRREWSCQFCESEPLSTKELFSAHTKSAHPSILAKSSLEALLLQSEEEAERIPANACHLCNDWEADLRRKDNSRSTESHITDGHKIYGQPKQFRRHLGRHMEQMALFALPQSGCDDGLDDDSSENDGSEIGDQSGDVISNTEDDERDEDLKLEDGPVLSDDLSTERAARPPPSVAYSAPAAMKAVATATEKLGTLSKMFTQAPSSLLAISRAVSDLGNVVRNSNSDFLGVWGDEIARDYSLLESTVAPFERAIYLLEQLTQIAITYIIRCRTNGEQKTAAQWTIKETSIIKELQSQIYVVRLELLVLMRHPSDEILSKEDESESRDAEVEPAFMRSISPGDDNIETTAAETPIDFAPNTLDSTKHRVKCCQPYCGLTLDLDRMPYTPFCPNCGHSICEDCTVDQATDMDDEAPHKFTAVDGPEYNILITNLGQEVNEAMLTSVFRPIFPSCKSSKIVVDDNTGISRGYGFVRFSDEHEQSRALTEMEGVYCGNQPMRISIVRPYHKSGEEAHPSPQAEIPDMAVDTQPWHPPAVSDSASPRRRSMDSISIYDHSISDDDFVDRSSLQSNEKPESRQEKHRRWRAQALVENKQFPASSIHIYEAVQTLAHQEGEVADYLDYILAQYQPAVDDRNSYDPYYNPFRCCQCRELMEHILYGNPCTNCGHEICGKCDEVKRPKLDIVEDLDNNLVIVPSKDRSPSSIHSSIPEKETPFQRRRRWRRDAIDEAMRTHQVTDRSYLYDLAMENMRRYKKEEGESASTTDLMVNLHIDMETEIKRADELRKLRDISNQQDMADDHHKESSGKDRTSDSGNTKQSEDYSDHHMGVSTTEADPSVSSSRIAPRPVGANRSASAALPSGAVHANEELTRWAKAELSKGLNTEIDVDGFVELLSGFPHDASIIADSVYGASKLMDGRRFAEEYLRRRKLADKGARLANSWNSYWSPAQKDIFPELLKWFGTDWDEIARFLSNKSVLMIMDFYQRKGSAGDSSWQNSVKVADRMRASRDPTEPLPKRLVEYKENEAHQRRIDAEISSGSYESKNQAASPISNVTTGKVSKNTNRDVEALITESLNSTVTFGDREEDPTEMLKKSAPILTSDLESTVTSSSLPNPTSVGQLNDLPSFEGYEPTEEDIEEQWIASQNYTASDYERDQLEAEELDGTLHQSAYVTTNISPEALKRAAKERSDELQEFMSKNRYSVTYSNTGNRIPDHELAGFEPTDDEQWAQAYHADNERKWRIAQGDQRASSEKVPTSGHESAEEELSKDTQLNLDEPSSRPIIAFPTTGPLRELDIIKCICGYKGNDGSIIPCVSCDNWQHSECYYPGKYDWTKNARLEHLCIDCKPRILNAFEANRRQRNRQEGRSLADMKSTSMASRDDMVDADSLDPEVGNSDLNHGDFDSGESDPEIRRSMDRSRIKRAKEAVEDSRILEWTARLDSLTRRLTKQEQAELPFSKEEEASATNDKAPLSKTARLENLLVRVSEVEAMLRKDHDEADIQPFRQPPSEEADQRHARTLRARAACSYCFKGKLICFVPVGDISCRRCAIQKLDCSLERTYGKQAETTSSVATLRQPGETSSDDNISQNVDSPGKVTVDWSTDQEEQKMVYSYPPRTATPEALAEKSSTPDRTPRSLNVKSDPEKTAPLPQFKCPKCPRTFADQVKANRHARYPHTYTCTVPNCGWSYNLPKDLRRHSQIHNPIRYPCPHQDCPTREDGGGDGAFSRPDLLKRHLEKFHI